MSEEFTCPVCGDKVDMAYCLSFLGAIKDGKTKPGCKHLWTCSAISEVKQNNEDENHGNNKNKR